MLYLPPLGRNSNVKFWLPNSTPAVWGVRAHLGIENSTTRNVVPMELLTSLVVPTFIFDFYTNYRFILHRFATIGNAADKQQTERSE